MRGSLLLRALIIVVFIGGMGLMAVRDHHATARCHQLGGQTYDSGKHCIIGGRTVSTR
jgi:hypothetical protein